MWTGRRWSSASPTPRPGAPLELPITRQLASILDRRWTESGHLKGGWVFPSVSSRRIRNPNSVCVNSWCSEAKGLVPETP